MSDSTFASGIEQYIPHLRRYARALTRGDLARAEDLVQDTLARAIAKHHLFEPGTNLRAWLFTLMFNMNVNHMRGRQRNLADALAPDDSAAIERHPARDDPSVSLLIRDMKRALMRLPPDMRRAILLVGYHGLSYERAAEVEGVPVGTIRSRLFRGREELRLIMEGSEMQTDDLDLIEWARGR